MKEQIGEYIDVDNRCFKNAYSHYLFRTFVIVLLAVYAIMMLISIPCMIIIFPFALIKAEIELKAQKNELNKEEKENI